MKKDKRYYLGLDIGTDSVGYAVTNEKYDLLKFHGEPAWGVTVFDEGSLSADRRGDRSARRRLDRKKQRRSLVQELFAEEIGKIDTEFFTRLRASRLFKNDRYPYSLFNDEGYTDKEYHEKYPTIHHLICDLMECDEKRDIRLVYLACAWLVTHRGHFLSNISLDNIDEFKDFEKINESLMHHFTDNGYDKPWNCTDMNAFSSALKEKSGITAKTKRLNEILFEGKAPKNTDEFNPYNRESMVKLIAGGTVKLKDVFAKEEYDELGSIALSMDDEKLMEIASGIGEDFALIEALRAVYDWGILADSLGNSETISAAKVEVYEQHKRDLELLKRIVKKYIPDEYDSIFRNLGEDNYPAYVYHTDEAVDKKFKRKGIEEFSKFILKKTGKINPDAEDKTDFEDMIARLELRAFLPKQKTTDNRVIPCQLYHYELIKLLRNMERFYTFLGQNDEGMTVIDKLESIFMFKIPYFVGPLNSNSEYAWLKRQAGKIYPWNFDEMVDLDESENNFIRRMTNSCTYLPGESVVPKDSLIYHRYMVLNEINNIRINGERISVELKQELFNELFMCKKKVTRKKLIEHLISKGVIHNDEEELVTGIDIAVNSNLSTHIAFRSLMEKGILTTEDVEAIIERSTYAEDKSRLNRWIESNYPEISEEDRKYICRIKISDFGRLSRRFLAEMEGVQKSTGEVYTIIGALWNTQDNLMELLSQKYTFADEITAIKEQYYSENPSSLNDRLGEMRISNAVKRSVYRTLAIVKDVEKAFGSPSKIFIETTRSASDDKKGKRTSSRKQQIIDLYKKCKDEDVRLLRQQLEDMGDLADNRLRGDKLFLYFMQLGKCMYSGKTIDLKMLGSKVYDIDHIYPQAYVKDDSVLNNKVLVMSEENGKKSDTYPIEESIRKNMYGYWEFLKNAGLITDEKFKRLKRNTPFTEAEKLGFINRQLVETSQSAKAVAEIIKSKYPEAEIVYCKADLVSEFRHSYDLLKSRSFNDLHHAKDAYLNIVTGNVYSMKFTRQWFNPNARYSIKTTTLFEHPVVCGNETVWDGKEMLGKVKRIVAKNNAHFTKFAYFKHGGLFDQMPVRASEGLVPLKKGLDTEMYGGYNKSSNMFFIPVRYKTGKKSELFIMPVELMVGKRFLSDAEFSKEYAKERLSGILGKKIDSVEYPMGMRPWKVNTMLELDGFRVCISGCSSGGRCLIAQPVMQFSESLEWNNYLKKVERLVEKCAENKNYIYDPIFDSVDGERNLKLYDIYVGKYEKSIFRNRVNPPIEILKKGRSVFEKLNPVDQARALIKIHETFSRIAGGCDLTLIGGSARAASTQSFSATVSNWKYSVVQIVDASVSGLWEKRSMNIMELL